MNGNKTKQSKVKRDQIVTAAIFLYIQFYIHCSSSAVHAHSTVTHALNMHEFPKKCLNMNRLLISL